MSWTGPPARCRDLAAELARAFPGRLYIELQRHHDAEGRPVPEEQAAEGGMIDIAYALDLLWWRRNDVHFPKPDLFDAHDALICISDRAYVDDCCSRRLTPQHYFKTPAEMAALFDLPEAVENTVEIARRCAFAVSKHKPILPGLCRGRGRGTAPSGLDGLRARLCHHPPCRAP